VRKTLGCACLLLLALFCLAGCQTAPGQIRVLTYNIHHGEGTDGKLDLSRIAEVIKAADPDLVALQEVDSRTQRTGQVDQTAELGRLTKLHAVFGKAIDYSGGQYGAAILSRWPFVQTEASVLPASPGHEIRPALGVRLKPPGWRAGLTFVSIHLDHQSERERLAQAGHLLELLAPSNKRPTILAGDFNALPQSAVMRLFAKEWTNTTAHRPLFTIPSGRPDRQIDYVLCRPARLWRVLETRVIQSDASDHCPLLVVLGDR
jgi:endonuclease/exonuclease/phosphatase family metal-dependent hydrolase